MPELTSTIFIASLQSAFTSAWKYFTDGGSFMWPLLACLVLGITVILFKLITLRRETIIPASLEGEVANIEACIEKGQIEPLLKKFDQGKSALARLSAVAVHNRGKSQTDISDAVQTAARHEVLHLNAGMAALDIAITISPLLGLLGTASGLAYLFAQLGASGDMSNTQVITKGIAEALNTTIFGLAITVPCVVAQTYFNRRIESYTTELELLLSKLVHVCQKVTTRP